MLCPNVFRIPTGCHTEIIIREKERLMGEDEPPNHAAASIFATIGGGLRL